ncbi:MAG: SDR family oxidoreductase [Phycisphaerales bacterium]|nr:SDR family oxidoreductase [Phycisphaerales bacterium]
MTDSSVRERVLVTGASAGIGLELARCFAADGSDLVLVARRADRLDELAAALREAHGGDVRTVAVDLATSRGTDELMQQLGDQKLRVDILANNAGFGARGPFIELDLERQLEMIRLNVVALVELTGRLLPAMVEHGRGGVLNVASVAAFQPGPRMAMYYATKAMVLSFSEALHEELRGTPIHVSCLCPGPTASEFSDVAGMRGSRMFQGGVMSAEAVARAGVRGLRRNRAIVIPGLANKVIPQLERFVPRRLVRWVAARMQ